MSANIPAIVYKLKRRRRVMDRAKEIEQSMINRSRTKFWGIIYEVITEEREINRLRRVRFR